MPPETAPAAPPAALPALPERPSPPHILELDGVRGVAILLVLAFHLVGENGRPLGRADVLVQGLANAGWVGVDLFFVLSGFLITGILWAQKGRDGYYRSFVTRRALRIFPLYYAFLVVYLLVIPAIWPGVRSLFTGPDAVLWLYLQNIKGHSYPVNHFWSLAVEEQFYLLWPWLVAACSRRTFLWMCGGAVAVALAARVVILAGWVPLHPIKIYTLLPTRVDALAMGAWLAVLTTTEPGRAVARRVAPWALALGGALFLGSWFGLYGTWDPLVRYSAPGLAFVGAIHYAVRGPEGWYRRALRHRSLRFWGTYSYGIYVFHFPVIVGALLLFGTTPEVFGVAGGSHLLSWAAYSAGVVGLTVALALASWRLVEQPFLRLKNRPRAAPAASNS